MLRIQRYKGSDVNSKYFNRKEFSCSCGCGFDAVDVDLLEMITKVREKFGAVIVHCACRCKKKNDEVGSKDTSQHLRGKAIDFHVKGIVNDKIAYWIDEQLGETGGVGIYDWGVHLDLADKGKRRWDNRT